MSIKIIGRALATIFCIGLVISVLDEGLRIYRGWKNREGIAVAGWALYEKDIVAERMELLTPQPFPSQRAGWEIIDFHQVKLFCDWQKYIKQRNWADEREQKKQIKLSPTPNSPLLYSANELPEVRYRCVRTNMFYRPGMGWGLF